MNPSAKAAQQIAEDTAKEIFRRMAHDNFRPEEPAELIAKALSDSLRPYLEQATKWLEVLPFVEDRSYEAGYRDARWKCADELEALINQEAGK